MPIACKVLPSQFPPVHHRPAPRRFSRLLRPSGAADAAYRFDRGARHRVRPVLCRKPGLPAEPRQPDDRAHAVGARRAQQRHSAVDGRGDLRRSAARRRLPHRAGRQEPSAELHAGTIRSSSGRRRARAFTSRRRSSRRRCATISPIRNTSRRRRNTGPSPGAHVQTPFYGFDHVTLVRAHGDEPGGDYDRWLDARDPKAKNLLGPKNSLPHDYTRAAGLSHRDPGGALRHRVPRRARLRLSRRGRRRRAVLPDGVVSRSAPSVQSAGQILGHVQARAVRGAGGVLAQRLDAAGAGAEHHQGAREPARPTSPAWAPSASRRARRRRRGR